jgi:O-6-methylguanine DNA methyltransferase
MTTVEPVGEFARRVLDVVRRVPHGKVTTYGEVARLAGYPGAARAVGRILSVAPRAGLPYHRVIAAGGALGGFGGDPAFKAQLLSAEGVVVARGRVRNLGRVSWPSGRTNHGPIKARR